MKINPDSAAFARPGTPDGGDTQLGLTKREYFAAMALQGVIASDMKSQIPPGVSPETVLAMMSVKLADTLIAALNIEHRG